MAKDIKCAHCNSRRLVVVANQKNVFQCTDCKGMTDIGGNRMVARIVGTTLGMFLTGLTLGLIPDEIQDQISDVAGDFVGDLLS
jgi:hypothetical protein